MVENDQPMQAPSMHAAYTKALLGKILQVLTAVILSK